MKKQGSLSHGEAKLCDLIPLHRCEFHPEMSLRAIPIVYDGSPSLFSTLPMVNVCSAEVEVIVIPYLTTAAEETISMKEHADLTLQQAGIRTMAHGVSMVRTLERHLSNSYGTDVVLPAYSPDITVREFMNSVHASMAHLAIAEVSP